MARGQQSQRDPSQEGADMMLPMLAMMGMCIVVFSLAVLIPIIGTAPGIAVGLLAGALMVIGHRKFMRHH